MRQPSLRFSWESPTHRTDGTEITPEDINRLNYRLYEDGDLVVDDIGELNFELLMGNSAYGIRSYTVTAVLFGLESDHSDAVTVNFTPTMPPANLQVEWVEDISVGGLVS